MIEKNNKAESRDSAL